MNNGKNFMIPIQWAYDIGTQIYMHKYFHFSSQASLKNTLDTWRESKLEEINSSPTLCVSTMVKSFHADHVIAQCELFRI